MDLVHSFCRFATHALSIPQIHGLYHGIAIGAILFLVALAATHLVSWAFRPAPLKLLPDSVVVIVGGCMGIGNVMAVELARQFNSRIVVVDRRKDLYEDLVKSISSAGGSCDCLNYDLSRLEEVEKLTEYLKKYYQKIDFLLYNAGVFYPNEAWEASDYELHSLMQVNFFSPAKIIKELLRNVENSTGKHIAVVASVASIIPGGTALVMQPMISHRIWLPSMPSMAT